MKNTIFGYCFGQQTTVETDWRRQLKLLRGRCNWFRTYGIDERKQVLVPLAHEFGFKIAQCAWIARDEPSNERQVSLMISAAKRGETDIAIIGSEALLRKEISPFELAELVRRFKKENTGVPVMVTDDVFDLLRAPEVLDVCDIVGAHIYPYWRGVSLSGSMDFLRQKYSELVDLSGKEVLIAETGWPSGGNTVGEAVPTPENAKRYFEEFIEWADHEGVRYFYFEAFDESWKSEYEGPQGAWWGRLNENQTDKR